MEERLTSLDHLFKSASAKVYEMVPQVDHLKDSLKALKREILDSLRDEVQVCNLLLLLFSA